jgi:phage terminase small subunit
MCYKFIIRTNYIIENIICKVGKDRNGDQAEQIKKNAQQRVLEQHAIVCPHFLGRSAQDEPEKCKIE